RGRPRATRRRGGAARQGTRAGTGDGRGHDPVRRPGRAGSGADQEVRRSQRMIPMTLGEIAAAVGGTLVDADPDVIVTGTVEFDSRKVGPGGLFVAFDGAKLDGHDFAG